MLDGREFIKALALFPLDENMISNVGIYCIYFEALDNMYYIGCSHNLDIRIREHISKLSNNKHINSRLQNAYNKYGKPIIEILENTSIEDMYDREIFWISKFDSYHNGFNSTNGGEGGFGEGANPSKYKQEDYDCIYMFIAHTNYSYSDIAKHTGVSEYVVGKIASGKIHTYLQDKFPEEFKIISNKRSIGMKAARKVYPKVISPIGEIFDVLNASSFAKEHNLCKGNFLSLMANLRKTCNGWKIYEG